MTPRDWFALGVRLLGVWMITQSASYVGVFLRIWLGLTSVTYREESRPSGYLIYATIDLALAAIFLLWTRTLVDWTYGADPANKSDVE